MTTRRIPALDRAFLALDSAEVSSHVAALIVCHLPQDAPEDYLKGVVAQMHAEQTFVPPFNYRLARGALRALVPAWEVLRDDDIDLGHHIRHSALPKPGGEVELGRLVSRLHSRPLDPTKPLWEIHVIEGLENDRWALYAKVHHALMDGVGAMRRVSQMLSSDPDDPVVHPIWSAARPHTHTAATAARAGRQQRIRDGLGSVKDGLGVAGELGRAAGEMVREARRPSDPDRGVPFVLPSTPRLNGRVTRNRRVAVQSFELARVRAVAAAAEVTINDVFMAIAAGALRRYLLELDELPDDSLIAGAPVSVRVEGDADPANAIAFILVKIGTEIADPRERLEAISRSSTIAKASLKKLSKGAADQYALLTNGPYIAGNMVGLGGRLRPPYNLVLSNVPGPTEQQYLARSPVYGLYPLSVVLHGQALNITVTSNSGRFNIGVVGDRDALPSLQKLAVYAGDALTELEAKFGAVTPRKRSGKR